MPREFLAAMVDGTVRIGVWRGGSRGGTGGCGSDAHGAHPVAVAVLTDVMTVAVLIIPVATSNGRSHASYCAVTSYVLLRPP